jgi:transcriptional regulator with XRE-family HTH domain
MQFHEKLKAYRISAGWTQEQLAEKIYVSRVTVSKWETGRGFPNLGSLQHIAALFSVTVDDLLSTDELVTIVQNQVHQTAEHLYSLIFGILDFLVVLLLVLPVFSGTTSVSVTLFEISPVGSYLQPLLIATVSFLALFGVAELALQQRLSQSWSRKAHLLSLVFSLILLILFVSTRQPYPGMYMLCLLVAKSFLLLRQR